MRIQLQRETFAYRLAVAEHDGVFWHGSPSGDLRGGASGLHVGTYEAARQALEARIGRRADGKPWDGTQEYGKTLLDRNQYSSVLRPGEGWNWDKKVVERPAELPNGKAAYGDSTLVPMDAKPSIFPVRITGPMTNTTNNPYQDWKANGYMHAQVTRGRAKRGYYYGNQGEGVTIDPLTGNAKYSVSAVVPNGNHLQLLSRDDYPFPQGDFTPEANTGYSAGFYQ